MHQDVSRNDAVMPTTAVASHFASSIEVQSWSKSKIMVCESHEGSPQNGWEMLGNSDMENCQKLMVYDYMCDRV